MYALYITPISLSIKHPRIHFFLYTCTKTKVFAQMCRAEKTRKTLVPKGLRVFMHFALFIRPPFFGDIAKNSRTFKKSGSAKFHFFLCSNITKIYILCFPLMGKIRDIDSALLFCFSRPFCSACACCPFHPSRRCFSALLPDCPPRN